MKPSAYASETSAAAAVTAPSSSAKQSFKEGQQLSDTFQVIFRVGL